MQIPAANPQFAFDIFRFRQPLQLIFPLKWQLRAEIFSLFIFCCLFLLTSSANSVLPKSLPHPRALCKYIYIRTHVHMYVVLLRHLPNQVSCVFFCFFTNYSLHCCWLTLVTLIATHATNSYRLVERTLADAAIGWQSAELCSSIKLFTTSRFFLASLHFCLSHIHTYIDMCTHTCT